MVTRRIPDPKIGGSIPSGVKFLFFFLKKERQRRDLNSRGQSPVDFESTSLAGTRKRTTPTRFELVRAEPIGFQNQLLNHSDTVPLPASGTVFWEKDARTEDRTRDLARVRRA